MTIARASLRQIRRKRKTPAEIVALVHQHQDEVRDLALERSQEMSPVFAHLKAVFLTKLHQLVTAKPDGSLHWATEKYFVALAAMHLMMQELHDSMAQALRDDSETAHKLATRHFAELMAALLIAFEKKPVPEEFEPPEPESTATIGSVRFTARVWRDLQFNLAVPILGGEAVASVDSIVTGLFDKYEFWADQRIQTDFSSAYNAQMSEGRRSLAVLLPALGKKWIVESTACAEICAPTADQVVAEGEDFETPIGLMSGPPAHPYCRCSVVPWRDSWS